MNDTNKNTTTTDTINTMRDIMFTIVADTVNPNGDPGNGNRPRQMSNGLGMITHDCIQHHIREELRMLGEKVWHLSYGHNDSIQRHMEEFCANEGKGIADYDEFANKLNETYADFRIFGGVAVNRKFGKIMTRGALHFTDAYTLTPIEYSTVDGKNGQQFYSLNGKHLYYTQGCIFPMNAKDNGVTENDMDTLVKAICNYGKSDATKYRPHSRHYAANIVVFRHKDVRGTPGVNEYALFPRYKECIDENGILDEDKFRAKFPSAEICIYNKVGC